MVARQRLNVTVDPYLVEDAKNLKINISNLLEETLRHTLNVKKQDSSKVNLKLLNTKIDRLQDEVFSKGKELRELITQKDVIEKQHRETREQELENQKAEIEQNQTCVLCAETDRKPQIQLKKGIICKTCYVDKPPKEIAQAMKQDAEPTDNN